MVSVIRASLPVAFGYVPLGMAFGVLLVGLGYAWWWAPVMGLFIYAGSAQFLAVGLLSAGAGIADTFVATLLLNLRHVFYGLAFSERYRALPRGRWYAVFGLTDETFSLVASNPGARVVALTAVNQAWWVLGCALGALVGGSLPFSTEGLAFSLTALFAVLFVEQVLQKPNPWPLVAAAGAAALFLVLLPAKFFLVASIAAGAVAVLTVPEKGS